LPILAIATSGPHGGLALARRDGSRASATLAAGRGRGRDLLPALRTLLADADLAPGELARVLVDVGPGSFTGVRVGVTVAKTLAWSLGIPVEAHDALALLASCVPPAGDVLAVRDAGRGGVYVGLWRDGVRVEPLARRPGPEIIALSRGATIVGEDAATLTARFDWVGKPVDVVAGPNALLDLGGAAPSDAAHDLAPIYLQASAPERKAAGEVN